MALRLWELHGDGRTVTPGAVVRPEERLSWGRTAGIGMRHVAAIAPVIAAGAEGGIPAALGGAPVLGEGAIASLAAGTAPVAPSGPGPDPRDRAPRQP